MNRNRTGKRRQQKAGENGWRSCVTHALADTVARTYIDRCRADYRPDGFYVLTQQEGGSLTYYPILVLHDAEAQRLHARSGFRIIGGRNT